MSVYDIKTKYKYTYEEHFDKKIGYSLSSDEKFIILIADNDDEQIKNSS